MSFTWSTKTSQVSCNREEPNCLIILTHQFDRSLPIFVTYQISSISKQEEYVPFVSNFSSQPPFRTFLKSWSCVDVKGKRHFMGKQIHKYLLSSNRTKHKARRKEKQSLLHLCRQDRETERERMNRIQNRENKPENAFLGQPIAQCTSNVGENEDINDTQELHLLPVFLQEYFLTI